MSYHPRMVIPRLALVLAVSTGWGCARGDVATPEGEPGAGQAAAAEASPSGPGAARGPEISPSSLGAGLDEVLSRAVVPPPGGGSTYRVDPFVAALVVAAVEREGGAWLVPFSGTPAKVDYEIRGFTITQAAERAGLLRLGLREGDVVEQVNGVAATDAATARGALAGADAGVTLGIFREDYSFVLSYRFEPGLSWSRTLEDLGLSEPPLVAGGEPGEADPSGDDGLAPSPSTRVAAGDGGRTAAGGKPGGRPAAGSSPKPSSAPSPPPSGAGKPVAGSPVACESDASCTIRRSYFDSMVSSPSKLEAQAKIVPAIRNDVFSGYKLSWVRPGSAIDQMGFRSGDKITHVNGSDLTDDAQAFALYLGMSSTKSYKVRYVRGAQTRTKTIRVT